MNWGESLLKSLEKRRVGKRVRKWRERERGGGGVRDRQTGSRQQGRRVR